MHKWSTPLNPLRRRASGPWVDTFEPALQVGALFSVPAVMDTLCTLVDVDTRDQKEPESGRTPRTVPAGSIVGLSGRGWTQALAHVVPDGVATHFLNQKILERSENCVT